MKSPFMVRRVVQVPLTISPEDSSFDKQGSLNELSREVLIMARCMDAPKNESFKHIYYHYF